MDFFSGRNHNQVKQFSFSEPLGNIFSPCLLLDTVALPYVGKFTWVTKPFLTIAMVSLNYPVIWAVIEMASELGNDPRFCG